MGIVGIQKEDTFVRVACLSMVNKEVFIDYLESTLSFEKNSYIVSGVDGQDLLIRHLKTPLKNTRALYKTLPFQLESLIPYPLSDVVIKPIYNRKEKETEALFFIVSKKNLYRHISTLQKNGIDPEWTSAVPMALYRFASFYCPKLSNLVVFHIGEIKIQLVSIRNHTIASHLTLHIGAKDFSDSKAVIRLRKEVDRAFCFFAHKEGESEEREVLFCGEKAKEIEVLLKNSQGLIPIQSDIEKYGGFSPDAIRSYAIPIGLAIEVLKNDQKSIQFRQNKFISKRTFKILKRQWLLGGIYAGTLFLLTFAFSELYYKKKEQVLSAQLEELIHTYQEEIQPLKSIKRKKPLKEALGEVKRAILSAKKQENIFVSPPLISDVLAFLSSHPKLEGIEIKQIDYELKSYPSLDHPQENYQPKVCVLFTTLDPKKARAFHDAIVEDNVFIDERGEIGWNRNENEYEITFFVRH